MNNNLDGNNNIINLANRSYKQNKKESYNEHTISNKLTLRKQKIQKEIFIKRKLEFMKPIKSYNEPQEKIEYTIEDFTNGKTYNDLKISHSKNDENQIKIVIYSISQALSNIQLDNLFFKKIFPVYDSSLNEKDDIKNKDNLPFLILEIALNTKDRVTFNYGFNLILNFSYISNTFCLEITNEKNIKEIFNRLIYFCPMFDINNSDIEEGENEKDKSYYFGSQILKIFGNLFLSSKSHEAFEANNYYNHIFFLLSSFDLDFKNKKNIYFRYEYLDTLLWKVNMLLDSADNIILKYKDNIFSILQNLIDMIRAFYYTQEIDVLYKIIHIIEHLSYINDEILIKIVESQGINNLVNLFGYLFTNDKNSGEIILPSDIISKILSIFINISTLESKYLQNNDYSQFALVLERLLSLYKVHHTNHFDMQSSLLTLCCNLACFNDIEGICCKILLNNNIIKYLFNYYNKYHLSEILQFIDNVAIKQLKKIRDYILNMGGFEIVKNAIFNYNEDNKGIMEQSISILYKIIEAEKAFNIRLLFYKLYQNSINEKIKNFYLNENYSPKLESEIKSIINDFEIYEKSLDD